jgi:cobalt-zinc-cadmium efflux system membrane fusion protein
MKNILYTIGLATLLFSCKEAKKEVEAPKDSGLITVTATQFKSSAMEIASPSEQDFNVTIKASGKIDVPPSNKAKITTFIGGYVKSSKLLIGDKVIKGQALLTLESTEFLDMQKDYLEVAEQINYLKSEFDRQKTLYDEKITSQKNYLKAESDYRRAKGMYLGLREKLLLLNINPAQVEKGKMPSTITIFSPISGDVTVMNANVGMFMSPSDVILEIINTGDLHVELSVFEKDILKVKEEQKILFTVPEASNENFQGKVHLVGKSIEGNDRTVNVHGHLDQSVKQRLITGMFVEARIVVASKKGLAIPTDALITENNKYYVLLLDNDKNETYSFKKVAVTVGEKTEKTIELLKNNEINTTSKILTKGVFDITN